jgi:hypothetical protein
MTLSEKQIEAMLIEELRNLKYIRREDITDRAALEANLRKHFQELNRVNLTDEEFARLLEEIVTPDVFTAAQTLRARNSFVRDDGTPLNYTLVNINDWCKNTFEIVNQLRINTDYSHHRYDVVLLINGVPVVQIELKTLGINPRRAMEQIVEYRNDPGNGYTRTLLCFVQLFVVSNRTDTWYFANNNARHFSFNADERFLPIYQHAAEDNTKITFLDDFAEKFLAKCTLGQMISRYMVLVASEQKLLIMRPYQIYAVKNIIKCIDENGGNGYVWHTTGSGKTLTSFKASTLLKANPASRNASSWSTERTSTARRAKNSIASRKAASNKTPTPASWFVACALTKRPTRSSSAPSRSSAWRWTRTASATGAANGAGSRPTWTSSTGCATSAWYSSSTNATARSSATTIRPSRSSSPRLSSSASPERPSLRPTPATSRSAAKPRR